MRVSILIIILMITICSSVCFAKDKEQSKSYDLNSKTMITQVANRLYRGVNIKPRDFNNDNRYMISIKPKKFGVNIGFSF